MKAEKPFWMPDTQGFLAVAILTLVGAISFILLLHNSTMDDKTASALTLVLGILLAALKDVYSFFFGSSKGSEKKDDALISGAVSPTSTPPIIPPSQPINIGDSTVVKSIAFIAVLVTGLMLFNGNSYAQAPKLRPLTGNLSNDLGITAAKPPMITGNVEKDLQALWDKIVASSIADLNYAAAMAKSANTQTSGVRLQCINAIITLNQQASGANLKNADGTPMVKPDPHVFTDVESLAEVIDNLSPQGPLFVNCAGAAQLAKTNVLTFVNAVVTGAAGFAAMPIIPGL